MRYLLTVIGTVLAGIAINALVIIRHVPAADMPIAYKATAVTPAPWQWNQCYAGMISGADMASNQTGTPTAGGILGCNYQQGALVYGFEGDVAAAKATQAPPTVDIRGLGNVALRVGYAWTGMQSFGPINVTNALFYGKVTLPAELLNPGDTIRTGWGLSGGVEYTIRPFTSMRYEYRFKDFNGQHAHEILTGIVLHYSPAI